MRSCAILKQAKRRYNIVSDIRYAQFYTVNRGVLMPAGNCVAGSAFLF